MSKVKAQGKGWPLWLLMAICPFIIGLIGAPLIIFAGDCNWVGTVGYLVAATAILIGGCVAWHHLRIIQGTEKATVLTNLDASWVGAELSLSRTEFLKFRKGLKSAQGSTEWQEEIANKLETYRKHRHTLYVQLFNMADFLETLGYFSKVGYILPDDAVELYGPAIRDYDEAFNQYILKRQEDEGDKSIYENFIWLSNKAKKQSG